MPDKQVIQANEPTKEKVTKKDYISAIGRRREAVARVRLYEHVRDELSWNTTEVRKGDILVNNKPISDCFPSKVMRRMYAEPMRITNTTNKYTFLIKVKGGGHSGQLDAVISGIARALDKLNNDEFHLILKKKGFLTRDSRVRERRKVGMKGKARRKMQSPKR